MGCLREGRNKMIKKVLICLTIIISLELNLYSYQRRLFIVPRFSIYDDYNYNTNFGFVIESFNISTKWALPIFDFGYREKEEERNLFHGTVKRYNLSSHDFYLGFNYYPLNLETKYFTLSAYTGFKSGISFLDYNIKDSDKKYYAKNYPVILTIGLCFQHSNNLVIKYSGTLQYHSENESSIKKIKDWDHYLDWGEYISIGVGF